MNYLTDIVMHPAAATVLLAILSGALLLGVLLLLGRSMIETDTGRARLGRRLLLVAAVVCLLVMVAAGGLFVHSLTRQPDAGWRWLIGGAPADLTGEGWSIGLLAEHGNYVRLGLILAFGLMGWLTVRSYRREGSAPRGAKVLLAGLRLVALALVLVVLLRPAILLRFTRTLHSYVVVVLDDSQSMSFVDRYAEDPATRRALAARLGIGEQEVAELTRQEIVQRILTGEDGTLVALSRNHPLLLMRFSTDQPDRESYAQILGEIDLTDLWQEDPAAARRRLAQRLEALSRQPDAPSGSGAAPTAHASLAGLSGPEETPGEESEAELAAAADALTRWELGRLVGSLRSSGFETHTPAALRAALERSRGRRVAGIVLVSDGQDTAPDASSRLAGVVEYAEQMGISRYALLVGDVAEPRNLRVAGLRAPRHVRRGEMTEFVAHLTHRNLEGEGVTVRLESRPIDEPEWRDTGVRAELTLGSPAEEGTGSDRSHEVAMQYEPQELGEFVVRAVVDVRPDEANPHDNEAEALIDVSDDVIRVLLVGGDAGMEFQYLRNFLLRQPDSYRVTIWQQNADGRIRQSASPGMPRDGLPRELVELLGSPGQEEHPGYDVVILCDPQSTDGGFDTHFVEMLREFVENHGGGLCYIAGKKHTERVGRSRELYRPLLDLLPVYVGPNTLQLTQTIMGHDRHASPVELTNYGLDHPVMRLATTSEQSAGAWSALPGIYWSHPVVHVKPAARVLALNPHRRTEHNEAEPLVAVQPFGNGRVLYVGTDDTWRWRMLRDGYYHRRFWGNVVRYLASPQARQVVISTGGDSFATNERIRVEVEAYDEHYAPLEAPTFTIRIVETRSGEGEDIVLPAVPDRPGQYRLDYQPPRAGVFELTALVDDPLRARKVASRRVTIQPPRAELERTEASAANLQRLVSRPQYLLHVSQADRLLEWIPPERLTAVTTSSRELWDTNLVLGLIVLLLVAEWAGRKKYNMA